VPSRPSRKLVTFQNPHPGRDYVIRHECPEYTAVCPVTGQPDFGTIVVLYVPDRLCVELKSLKLYLWAFRDEGHYFEQVTNQILEDLVAALRPRRMTVIGKFNVRGGITTTVVARHDAQNGAPADAGARPRGGRRLTPVTGRRKTRGPGSRNRPASRS